MAKWRQKPACSQIDGICAIVKNGLIVRNCRYPSACSEWNKCECDSRINAVLRNVLNGLASNQGSARFWSRICCRLAAKVVIIPITY